jgi:hypothetical protein
MIVRTLQLGKTNTINHVGGGVVVAYFRIHLSLNLLHYKEGSHDSYLWLQVKRGVAPNLFICVVYVAPIASKHKNNFFFQNLGGIILLGGDFNACITMLLDTIDTNDLCELLQVLELDEIEQLGVVAE